MKNCLSCESCYLKNYDRGYSEYTPSSPMSLRCEKGHWEFNDENDSKRQLKSELDMAETCPDFKQDPTMETA